MRLPADLASCSAALRVTVDPAQVIAHREWRRVRREVLTQITSGSGPVAILGDAGTGKTMLLHDLAYHLEQGGRQIRLFHRADLGLSSIDREIALIDEADRSDKDALIGFLQRAETCVCAGLRSLAELFKDSTIAALSG